MDSPGLLDAEADAAFFVVDIQHLDLDFLAGRDDLAGMHVLLVQLISETWTRPSMPGSSSTNAP